eukprot:7177407-Prymnesium_polylepis.1
MPPKRAKEAVALQDHGHVHGWYYIVNASTGIVNVTVSGGKRRPYKLPRECAATRTAQRQAIRRWLRDEQKVDRGPADDTDDDGTDDDRRDHHRDRSQDRNGDRSRGDSSDGRRSRSRGPDIDLLGFGHDMVTECNAFVEEATAPFEPRFPRRRRTQAQQFSPSKGCSDYERGRAGSRHDRTREVSYEESRQNEAELSAALERERDARQRLNERHAEIRRVAREMQLIAESQRGALDQQTAAALQQALLEILQQEDDVDEPPADELVEESCGQQEAVLFEAASAVNGESGRVVLGAYTLLWGKVDAPEPTIRLTLSTISSIGAKRVQLNPFTRAECCT